MVLLVYVVGVITGVYPLHLFLNVYDDFYIWKPRPARRQSQQEESSQSCELAISSSWRTTHSYMSSLSSTIPKKHNQYSLQKNIKSTNSHKLSGANGEVTGEVRTNVPIFISWVRPLTFSPFSCSPAVSQCQQLSSLLHLAASHGLRTVASFLLQQPGGREALRRPNAQGLTPACLAESRGHQQLVELFTQWVPDATTEGLYLFF